MLKTLLHCIFLLALSGQVVAQEDSSRWEFGVEAGIGRSAVRDFYLNRPTVFDIETPETPAISLTTFGSGSGIQSGGIYARYSLSDAWALQGGLRFSNTVYFIDDIAAVSWESGDAFRMQHTVRQNTQQIDVPVLVQWSKNFCLFNKAHQLRLHAGPALGHRFTRYTTSTTTNFYTFAQPIHHNSASLTNEAGFLVIGGDAGFTITRVIGNRIDIGFRYHQQFSNNEEYTRNIQADYSSQANSGHWINLKAETNQSLRSAFWMVQLSYAINRAKKSCPAVD